jgi:hypothetical protein
VRAWVIFWVFDMVGGNRGLVGKREREWCIVRVGVTTL